MIKMAKWYKAYIRRIISGGFAASVFCSVCREVAVAASWLQIVNM